MHSSCAIKGIGAYMAGILGTHGECRRWVDAEWSGVWRGVFPPQPIGVCGSVVRSPSGVRGRAPTENGFWRILKAAERSFLYLYDKIWAGTICISVTNSIFWGNLSPSPLLWFTSMVLCVRKMSGPPTATAFYYCSMNINESVETKHAWLRGSDPGAYWLNRKPAWWLGQLQPATGRLLARVST